MRNAASDLGAKPFEPFWQAGYAGAAHVNPAGRALTMHELNDPRQRAPADAPGLARAAVTRGLGRSVGLAGVARGKGPDVAGVRLDSSAATAGCEA